MQEQWCSLSLNTCNSKEMVIDFGRHRVEPGPANTLAVVKKSQQWLHFLRLHGKKESERRSCWWPSTAQSSCCSKYYSMVWQLHDRRQKLCRGLYSQQRKSLAALCPPWKTSQKHPMPLRSQENKRPLPSWPLIVHIIALQQVIQEV